MSENTSRKSSTRPAPTTAYTSTVIAWGPAVLASAISVAIAAACLTLAGLAGMTVLIGVIVVAIIATPVGLHAGSVRLGISPTDLAVGSGIRGRTRWIPLTEITSQSAEVLSWPQVYGIGIPLGWRLTRMTVRAGSMLHVGLVGGEQLWISTDDSAHAAELLATWRANSPGIERKDHPNTTSKEQP